MTDDMAGGPGEPSLIAVSAADTAGALDRLPITNFSYREHDWCLVEGDDLRVGRRFTAAYE